MPPVQHEHTAARREALQVLYGNELAGDFDDRSMLLIPECPVGVSDNDLVGIDLADYARELIDGVGEHGDQIDAWIAETAENWTLERMPIVDRNIIRLAAFEIAYRDDIPTGVAINEAVEMAKAFGTDESPKFVNGVLGRIASRVCGQDVLATQPDEA